MEGKGSRRYSYIPTIAFLLLLVIAALLPAQATASSPGGGGPLLLPVALYYGGNVSYSLAVPVSQDRAVVVASVNGAGPVETRIILYNVSSGEPLASINYTGGFAGQRDLIFEAGLGSLPESYGSASWNPETHSFSAFYYNGTGKVWIAYYNPATGRIASEPRDLDPGYKPLGIAALEGSASALLAWNKQEKRLYVSIGAGMFELLRQYYPGTPKLLTAQGNIATLLYLNSQDRLAAAWFNSSALQPLGSAVFSVGSNYRVGVGPGGWVAVVHDTDSGVMVELASPGRQYNVTLTGYRTSLAVPYGPVWSNNTLVAAFTVEDQQGNAVLVVVNASTGTVSTMRIPVGSPWDVRGLLLAGGYPVLIVRSGLVYENVTVYTPDLSGIVGSISNVKDIAVKNTTLYVITEPQGPDNPVFGVYRVTSTGGMPGLDMEWETVLPVWNAGIAPAVLAPLGGTGNPMVIAAFHHHVNAALYRLTVVAVKPVSPVAIPTCDGGEVLLYPTGGPWHIPGQTVEGDGVKLTVELTAWKGAITVEGENGNITVYGILTLASITATPVSPGGQGSVKVKLAVNTSGYTSIPGKPALRQVCISGNVKPDSRNGASWSSGVLRYIIPVPADAGTRLVVAVQALDPLMLKPGASPITVSIEGAEISTPTTTTSTTSTTTIRTIIKTTSIASNATTSNAGATGSPGGSSFIGGFAGTQSQAHGGAGPASSGSGSGTSTGGGRSVVGIAAVGIVIIILVGAVLFLRK